MKRAFVWTTVALLLGACAPFWNIDMGVRDPSDRAVEDVTLAVACTSDDTYDSGQMAARSDHRGNVSVGGIGNRFPPDCDIYVAKPGFRTQKIRYRDLCPKGPNHCERNFRFDLVLEPERRLPRVGRR
jgi:hypothetical protein